MAEGNVGYASIWKLTGEAGAVRAGYESLLAAIPAANMRLHVCLEAPDGLLVVDTCPSREAFDGFAAAFPSLAATHALPEPQLVAAHPVHAAFVDGERRA